MTIPLHRWRRSIQSGLFQHQIPPVSSEKFTLPRSARCALSRLCCNGNSTFLGTYLYRFGRAETPSCSNCGSESQNFFYLVLDCPVLDFMPLAIFCHYLSILDLWSRPWGFPNYWDSAELICAPRGMGPVSPPPSSNFLKGDLLQS